MGLATKAGSALGRWLGRKFGLQEFAKPPKIKLSEYLDDLKTDSRLCESHILNLIERARGARSLRKIIDYLHSDRNNIPQDVTSALIRKIEQKIAAVTAKNFAEVADDVHTLVGGWFHWG